MLKILLFTNRYLKKLARQLVFTEYSNKWMALKWPYNNKLFNGISGIYIKKVP